MSPAGRVEGPAPGLAVGLIGWVILDWGVCVRLMLADFEALSVVDLTATALATVSARQVAWKAYHMA